MQRLLLPARLRRSNDVEEYLVLDLGHEAVFGDVEQPLKAVLLVRTDMVCGVEAGSREVGLEGGEHGVLSTGRERVHSHHHRAGLVTAIRPFSVATPP